jgi:hypothetical protein
MAQIKDKAKPNPKGRTIGRTVAPMPLSWRMAEMAGFTTGAKTKHLNAKVSPKLFAAAARRLGTESPVAVIEAALAALATQDDLGPWLAEQWGSLAHVDPELLDQLTA